MPDTFYDARSAIGNVSELQQFGQTTLAVIDWGDRDGDMLCIDMDPALEDRMGKIAYFDRCGEIEQGYGASCNGWLSSLADRLDAERFRIDDYGYLWLDIEA